jgi:hypothetical protein
VVAACRIDCRYGPRHRPAHVDMAQALECHSGQTDRISCPTGLLPD